MLFELLIAGGVTYAGVRAYQHRRQPTLAYLLVNDTARQVADNDAAQDTAPRWYQRLPGLGDLRRQQLAQLAADGDQDEEREITAYEHEINRYIGVSLACLGVTTAGLFYPPLALISVPGILYICVHFVRRSIKDIFYEHKITMPVIDLLVIPGVFLTGQLFAVSIAATLYFASRKLLLQTEYNAHKSLISVFGQHPRSVWVLVDGAEIEVPFEQVQVGEIVVVHAGQSIPVDGTIVQGVASIDQHLLTGEAQPIEKQAGEQVFATTMLLSGSIQVRVDKAGQDTVAASIGTILNQTAGFTLAVQARGDKLADQSAPPTLALFALAVALVGVQRAFGVLWTGVGYNMRIAAPLGLMNYLQLVSQQGILIKDGRSLEGLHQVDTIVFDKTGTLTQEQPHVSKVHPWNGLSGDEVLAYAATAEYKQTHPIARAILQAARERHLAVQEIDHAHYAVGYGLRVQLAGQTVRVGSDRFLQMEGITLPADLADLQQTCHDQGYSLVYVALDETFVGVIELHPTIRPEARQIIQHLHQRRIQTCIISGDHEQPTRALAQELGIETYFANVLPEDKSSLVQQLQAGGRTVCFVGDGINDAIALKQATISISLRGASTIATDTAQIVLMDGSLEKLIYLFNVSDDFEATMRNSLVVSIVPGVVIAGGIFFLHWGLLAAIMLYNVGLVTNVGLAMLPLFKEYKQLPANA